MSVPASRTYFHFLLGVAGALTCVSALAIGLTIWWLHSDAIAAAYTESNDLATVLAEQTENSVQSIELVLTEVRSREEFRSSQTPNDTDRILRSENTYRFLMERRSRLPQAQFITLVDKNGKLVNTTQQHPTPELDLSDRAHFLYFKSNDDKNIYISDAVINRVTGVHVVTFSKRITGANNTFLGEVLVGVKLTYFQNIYESIASLHDRMFTLLHRNGTLMVRFPDQAFRAGETIPATSPWYRLVSQGGGIYRAPGFFDGQARLMAVRPLRNYPLVVNVGVSEAAALASWRVQALNLGAGALFVMLCVAYLLKAQSKQFLRLAKSEATVDAALNNMSQGLAMFDSSARLVVCNQRYLNLYRLPSEIVKPGCPFREIVACRIKNDNFFTDDIEAFISDLRGKLNRGMIVKKYATLRDGRIISVVDHPIADGGWVTTHEDVTELRRAEERIAHAAHYDELTDLANRNQLRMQLEEALKRVSRGEHFAVLYLDLDNFKFINDTLGHLAGDELLKAVAERLKGCVRNHDTLARLGGDEFGIIQAAIDQPSDAANLAVRILEALREPYDIAGSHFIVDASIGIAVSPDNGVEAEQLLKNADLAMYQAKANGRAMFCFFEPEMDARVKARSALEFELRQAIMCDQFELYYQPVVNLRDGTITGCEALLRWNHPERGLISPAEFIPIAEETGLITQLGEWALRTACTEAMTWPDDIKIAVNVSPVQFRNQALPLTVISALAASGLPASRLELEITETAIIHDEETTLGKISQLRELGVQIALDDFGTGYSSLSYLHRLPFDKIKIDQSFIKNLADNDHSIAIVQAITLVAKARNVITVAEGVETDQQRELLRMLGCSEMQGYLFSRPVPVQDLVKFFPTLDHRAADAETAA